ncbi:MAG: 4Fe-4S binding protein [Syntrophales bacterium]|nr:4Fe-4S binding protein [Syntrophales bacterium]
MTQGEDIYKRLAKVLDTLPNGFPATDSGVEIRLLKKIFTPEQAELFCSLRLSFETATQIAARTGLPLEGLEARLLDMARAGQVFMIRLGKDRFYRMLPWVFGIYEFQLGRMDRDFAALAEEYAATFSRRFFAEKPPLMQTLAVEEAITTFQEALPYEKVSTIIEGGKSFLVNECICKKEKGLLKRPCNRPIHVCLAVAPLPGVFDRSPLGRIITKDEAYDLLKTAEEAGLVHLTSNVQVGQFYICNCCKCCCGVLRAINEWGIPASQVVNSAYRAEIVGGDCIACGICADERCQVGAVVQGDGSYQVLPERCIGCGLCVNTCPTGAVRLIRKEREAYDPPPFTENEWYDQRGRWRGVDFSPFK